MDTECDILMTKVLAEHKYLYIMNIPLISYCLHTRRSPYIRQGHALHFATYFELILRFISAAVIGRSRAKNLSSIGLGVVEVDEELLSLDYKYVEISFENRI